MDELDKYCGCNKPVIVGCENQVDLECVYYTGDKLDPLNINSGANGNSILKIINDYIKNVLENLEVPETHIANIGNKIGIYKSLSTSFIHEFKTLSGIEGIVIENKGDYIELSVDNEWLLDNIIILFENQTFKDFFVNYLQDIFNSSLWTTFISGYLQNLFNSSLWTTFISGYLQNLFNSSLFNSYFSNYITNLIENGNIDICRLIEKCDSSHNYYMNGNVEYNVPNGVVNFHLIAQDFIDKYYDELGHTLVSIKITSGNLQGLVKGNGQPLLINDVIPVNEINNVTFTANNQNSPYTLSIGFVGINSNNEIVN